MDEEKKRNPWKTAFCVLAAAVVAVGASTYTGTPQVKATDGGQDSVVPSAQVLNPTAQEVDKELSKPLEVPQQQKIPPEMKADPKDIVPPPLREKEPLKTRYADARKNAKLIVHVIDGRTGKPLPDAEVVLIETGDRVRTDATGTAKALDAPVIRDDRFSEKVARLHGQLGLIAYKNGYRDSITFGVRTYEGKTTDLSIWMYQITPGDRRIEPVVHQVPHHRLSLIQLADEYRSPTQPGEGQESPDR